MHAAQYETARLAHRVDDAATLIGVKRSTIYNLMRDGKLSSVKVGGVRLIPDAALRELLQPAKTP